MFAVPDSRHYSFNILVKKYQEKIYWHVRRILIDHEDTNDAVQNIFIKVWMNLDTFRKDSNLFTWIYRIAVNESLSMLKKKRLRFFLPLADAEHELKNKIESDPLFTGDVIQRKLQHAILTLPAKQRIVFNMKYFEEMKYEDMAEVLSTSAGALKASYHHAVKKIEKYFKDY